MKKNLVIFLLVVLTIINVAALVTIAYNRWHPKRHFSLRDRPDMHKNFLKQELDLTEEQIEQFEAHMREFRIEAEPILDSLRQMRRSILNEISADEPNIEKLDELAEEIGTLEIVLKKKLITHFIKGKSFLTPEQQKRFFSRFMEGLDRTRGFRGRGNRIEKGLKPPNLKDGR